MQPRFGGMPLTIDSARRYPHYFSRFLDRQAAKEAQLHHPALMRIDCLQLRQCLIEIEQVYVTLRCNSHAFVEGDVLFCAASFCRLTRPCMTDENAPHYL